MWQWAMGTEAPVDALDAFSKYSLRGIVEDVKCDVLILAAERDHMVPLKQASDLEKELVNARTVTVHVFADGEGAQEHCEFGAITQSHETIFDWIEKTFGRKA